MTEEADESVDAILCFDANLPKMDKCGRNCRKVKMVLCKHHFNFNARMIYCNTPKFHKVPDSEILLHFLGHIRNGIDKNSIPAGCTFVLLTKDHDFLEDAERELGNGAQELGLVFCDDFVIAGGIVIFIQLVDCKNYGTQRSNDRSCVVHKMNKFFAKLKLGS